MATIREANPGVVLVLDFLEVRRANSLGIIRWSKFVRSIKGPLEYRNVPMWLVEQLNLRIIALGQDAYVSSIMAPFYCGLDGTHEVHCLQIGQDLPILQDYSDFVIERVSKKGLKLEADFEPSEYFGFLARMNVVSKAG
jgi:hypothetical protein